MILIKTPNLKSLTINAHVEKDIIDASQWQHFISYELPHLNIFKFKFTCRYFTRNKTIEKKFKEFQSDFWCIQHHWYTEYSLSKNSASIYTIPYISNRYELTPYTERYCNEFTNNVNVFDNVTDLIVVHDAITEKCQHYFSHVNSLTLVDFSIFNEDTLGEIQLLKIVVNLFNIKHLTIKNTYEWRIPSHFLLTEILKETPQLSSLNINQHIFKSFIKNDELCDYLNKKIKILDVNGCLDEIEEFCEMFSNVEQLRCKIEKADSVLFLIKHLPKLLRINLRSVPASCVLKIYTFEEELKQIGVKIMGDLNLAIANELSIWIIRDID
jgi:hypothetical protein